MRRQSTDISASGPPSLDVTDLYKTSHDQSGRITANQDDSPWAT